MRPLLGWGHLPLLSTMPRRPLLGHRLRLTRARRGPSSDVTLNVCLGRAFEGGSLFFRGVRCRAHQQTGAAPEETHVYAHRPGVAVLHRGHHRHGAHAITSGDATASSCGAEATRRRAARVRMAITAHASPGAGYMDAVNECVRVRCV